MATFQQRRKATRIALAIGLILLPMIAYGIYALVVGLPKKVLIGTGATGGRYVQIAEMLKSQIESTYPQVTVELVQTEGSLENYLLLKAGKLDFAMYQPGVHDVFTALDSEGLKEARESAAERDLPKRGDGEIAFVANLYSQPAHLVVRRGQGIETKNLRATLKGKRIAVGIYPSGDYAMSSVLLGHLGLDARAVDKKYRHLSAAQYYSAVTEAFENDELDAAFITVGVRADVFADLGRSGKCDMISIPHTTALRTNHLYLLDYTIPAGLYGDLPDAIPVEPAHTIAAGAQLLTRSDVPEAWVDTMTRIILNKDFARKNHLPELFEGGTQFAQSRPSYPMHTSAQSHYDPEFDIGLVESWEAMYSLVASVIIGSFLGIRWLLKRKERAKEHRLDRYIRALLAIERRQVLMDSNHSTDEIDELQTLLDDVTKLRQEALREFTTHDINEDRGPECFMQMCHALSTKINAKLSRQRLDAQLRTLADAIAGSTKLT